MAETPSELRTEVEKLERKHAENPEGRFFVPLANAYRRLGQLPSAESLLREGLRWHPEYLSAHIVLGRCLADRGAADEAIQEFRYVLSQDPQNLIALRSLGELSLGAGRPEEAERWYRELLAADPMNEEARRALSPFEAEDEAEAADFGLPTLEEAPRATPVPWPSAARAGDPGGGDEGEGEDLAALEEEESPELVTETIAELYARQGLHARSAEVYRELIRRRGGDAALERRLAEVESLAAGGEPPREAPPAPEAPAPEPAAEEDDLFAAFSYVPSAEPEMDAEPLPAAEEPEPFAGASLPVAEPEPVEEPEPAAEAEASPTIARFLADLAAWRPAAEPRAEAPPAWEPEAGAAPGGTVTAADEPLHWEPPAPAEETAPEAEPEREALLSYGDYLVGEPEPPAEAPRAEAAPEEAPRAAGTPAAAAEEEDDDLESFQAWLRSLKR